jgi:hypothetical protein
MAGHKCSQVKSIGLAVDNEEEYASGSYFRKFIAINFSQSTACAQEAETMKRKLKMK